MTLKLISAGKTAVLSGKVSADLYIDCRGMMNPFRDPVLGGLSGDAPEMQDWIEQKNAEYINAAEGMINTAIHSAPTRNSFAGPDGKLKPLTVCFFCLAGVHRSRGLKNVVAKLYKTHYPELNVEVA